MYETEVLIVGAGIVGLALAKELLNGNAQNIILIEKESGLGFHASGRNSGVLHAGIYYPPETLKAKLCLQGNLLLQEYCKTNGVPLVNCGKVIVARDESELPTLQKLYERALQNGARVDMIDERDLGKFEPNARTVKQALYSHYTAMVDNKAVLHALEKELLASGRVKILYDTKMTGLKNEFTAQTTRGDIRFKRFINAAGAYADKVAHHFGVGNDYYFIPFKGIYHKLIPSKQSFVNGNIYPVPNLKNPFLGVHFSKNIGGDVYVGPTAIPAFGRENYGILRGIDREVFKIIRNEILLYFTNAEFRTVAWDEPKKYIPKYFFNDARKLVKTLQPEWLVKSPKVGIRPQLISLREKKLMMDFLVIKERHSLHILNAISPAFTSSLAFGKYVIANYW
jgi:L-2-hydroxyglutarate oxidase LhgO